MKVQSRIGVTIPKNNLDCCCVPVMYKPTESTLDHTVNLIPYGCSGYDIEWYKFDFDIDEWVLSQTGSENYEWSGLSDVSLVRVKMTKVGCCDVYSTAILFIE